jgi:hypothetical protein
MIQTSLISNEGLIQLKHKTWSCLTKLNLCIEFFHLDNNKISVKGCKTLTKIRFKLQLLDLSKKTF